MSDYTVKRIGEMEAAFGGSFKRARAELGVTSFGMQVIDLPPDSGELYPEHDHLHDDQEEIYLLLAGSGELELPGGRVPMDAETMIRVGPGTRRRFRSGPEGARLLAVGGIPGRVFEPQPNSELGGPETLAPTARSSMIPA